jgi:hypothetical protein
MRSAVRGDPADPATVRAAHDKAATLVDALPWLERFRDSLIVVKYGGNAMTERKSLQEAFAQDIAFLRLRRAAVVVVHGGGPADQGHAHPARASPSEFKGGLRVTTPEVMDVVRMVLTGSGRSGARRPAQPARPDRGGPVRRGRGALRGAAPRRRHRRRGEDIGLVGDVVQVNPSAVRRTFWPPAGCPSSPRSPPISTATDKSSMSTPTPPPPPSRSRSAPANSSSSPTSRASMPPGRTVDEPAVLDERVSDGRPRPAHPRWTTG